MSAEGTNIFTQTSSNTVLLFLAVYFIIILFLAIFSVINWYRSKY